MSVSKRSPGKSRIDSTGLKVMVKAKKVKKHGKAPSYMASCIWQLTATT
jgi:hypothetical protein